MKSFKKILAVAIVIVVLGTVGVAYAATSKTPAQIVAGLTGKSVEDLNKECAEGKTYGTIANEAGKLDEFKSQMLEQRKAILDQRVKDGRLTQEQADGIYETFKKNQAACDGNGAGVGQCNGMGQGQGQGQGRGRCAGMGNGCR